MGQLAKRGQRVAVKHCFRPARRRHQQGVGDRPDNTAHRVDKRAWRERRGAQIEHASLWLFRQAGHVIASPIQHTLLSEVADQTHYSQPAWEQFKAWVVGLHRVSQM